MVTTSPVRVTGLNVRITALTVARDAFFLPRPLRIAVTCSIPASPHSVVPTSGIRLGGGADDQPVWRLSECSGGSMRTSRINGHRVARRPREAADQQSATASAVWEPWAGTRGAIYEALAWVIKPSVAADPNEAASRHREVAAPEGASSETCCGVGARTNTTRHDYPPAVASEAEASSGAVSARRFGGHDG